MTERAPGARRRASFEVWVAVGALALLALAPRSATAQTAPPRGGQGQTAAAPAPRPTPEQIATARETFELGEQLFTEGDYAGAADMFAEAYAAVPDPTLLFRIGDAKQRAEDFRGAVTAYEEYLRLRPEAPERADVESRLEALRQVPGTLAVASTPGGAAVTVDGQPVEGVTPLEVPVAPGQHLVAITLDGYAPGYQEVEVGFDERVEVAVELAPAAEVPEDALGAEGGPVAPPASTAPATQPGVHPPSAGVWVVTGIAGAGLVTATVFGFLAMDRQSEYDDTPGNDLRDEGRTFALVTDIGLGVAAAAAITAVALYLVEKNAHAADEAPEQGARVDLAPVLGRNGGGVAAQVRF